MELGNKNVRLPTPKKRVEWIASSKKDLEDFPDPVQHDIGYALMIAQFGGKHKDAKPWKGLSSGVMEIVNRFDSDTYRAVYMVNIGDVIYVLHAFQKNQRAASARQERI